MNRSDIAVILLADAPDALAELCGVTLMERSLRILQRLEFARVVVVSATPETIGTALARPSWARAQLAVDLVSSEAGPLTGETILRDAGPETARCLFLPAGIYCDARLFAALRDQDASAALVDSNPPEIARPLLEKLPRTKRGRLCGPTLLTRDIVAALPPGVAFPGQIRVWVDQGRIGVIDAATQSDYIVSMRRHLRPLSFPAPSPEQHGLAERLVLDAAQKGTLDLPAYVHAPIETWIISRLCKTSITPNKITLTGFVIGISATVLFASGHVVFGTLTALLFGLVDGLDGKQSRVKIETTARGEWEHHLDYLIENSWWATIAFQLWWSGQLPHAFYFLALLIGSHLIDEFVKRRAKIATGRLLDDLTPFDRAFRLIGARRNVYIWILACGLLLDRFAQTFAVICGWTAVSAAVHLVRSLWICRGAFFRLRR